MDLYSVYQIIGGVRRNKERRLMSETGRTRSFGDVGPMSGFRQSWSSPWCKDVGLTGGCVSKRRTLSSRNKLATRVLQDLPTVWDEPVSEDSEVTKGLAALRVMAVEDPGGFAKLYSSLLPREFNVSAVADLGDSDLDAMIEKLRDELLIEHKVEPARLEFNAPKDYHRVD